MTTATATRWEVRADLIKPLPKQETYLDSLYKNEYTLYGGAAGPGKSYILRWGAIEMLVYWATQGHRDVRVGLFCEDYPTLARPADLEDREGVPGVAGRGTLEPDPRPRLLPPGEVGWGHDRPQEPGRSAEVYETEFAAIFVDELTRNPRQTFDDLRFRKRWPGIEHSPFGSASNPGSIGHGWVKKLFIDRDFSGDDDQLDPEGFSFIPALPADNPYLPASYWALLDSLPPAMRRAMAEGDWSVFQGQVFDNWRDAIHVVEPFPLPRSWTRWVSIDYGYANPFCALWFASSPDKREVYVYRELHRSGLTARQQAIHIKAAQRDERMEIYVADPSMWQKREGVVGDNLAGSTPPRGSSWSRRTTSVWPVSAWCGGRWTGSVCREATARGWGGSSSRRGCGSSLPAATWCGRCPRCPTTSCGPRTWTLMPRITPTTRCGTA